MTEAIDLTLEMVLSTRKISSMNRQTKHFLY